MENFTNIVSRIEICCLFGLKHFYIHAISTNTAFHPLPETNNFFLCLTYIWLCCLGTDHLILGKGGGTKYFFPKPEFFFCTKRKSHYFCFDMEINFFLPKLKLLKSAVSDLFILCSFQGYLEGKKIGDRN